MLTQAEIDGFHRDGYLIMRGLVCGRELDLLCAAADQIQADGVARRGEGHRYMQASGSLAGGTETYWRTEDVWDRAGIFQAATVNPQILENVGQCIGQAFYPWNDSLVVKLARVGASVEWHQDPPYGTPFASRNRIDTFAVPNFTTDIYLDYSGPDNGGLYAIPGVHLVGHIDLRNRTHEQLVKDCGAVPIEMEAGDVLFHCLSTPHGSEPNRSDKQRRIFYLHYLAQEVYDDAYAPEAWAKSKPGWDDARRSLVASMLRTRATLGLSDPTAFPTLRMTAGGIEFVGTPVTPQRHWATLSRKISADRAAAMKRLSLGSPAVRA